MNLAGSAGSLADCLGRVVARVCQLADLHCNVYLILCLRPTVNWDLLQSLSGTLKCPFSHQFLVKIYSPVTHVFSKKSVQSLKLIFFFPLPNSM